MSRFTGEEFDTAFQEVYPAGAPYKDFLRDILTNSIEFVEEYINYKEKNTDWRGYSKDKLITLIREIMNITGKHPDEKGELMKFINYINSLGVGSEQIQQIINQNPSVHNDVPIFKVCLKMFENREQGPTHPSALFASTPASARPSANFPIPKTQKERIQRWWALNDAGRNREAEIYYGAYKYPNLPPGVGGSRRRRSSHRKRKGYRKSKRVRHTPRKQTRRHRHRHRRSRHRR
jgi:hypothetical protein